jgi:hypothetical protein
MFRFAGAGLPDVDGALVESVLTHMVDRMRPAKGEQWEPRAARTADALVELARNYADVHALEHPAPLFVVHIGQDGPAEICGIPLPVGMVEKLRASAKVKVVVDDDDGHELAGGKATPSLSPRVRQSVLRRDGHCRCGDCDRRHGLQVHHLWPKSWGGKDEQSNLAGVCVGGGTDHHADLAPHGPWLLLGNPNRVDGLRLVHRDQLAAIAALAGLDDLLSLNGHPMICDPELLDDALARIRAGPVTAEAA